MTVTFTLKAGSESTDAGPFNISGTTSGGSSNGVSIATGVTKQQLLTGHTVTNINDTITGGTIASTGASCPSSTTTWSVTPTSTPTPTATSGPVTSYEYAISQSGSETRLDACQEFQNFLPSQAWAAEDQRSNVTRFFTDDTLQTPLNGSGYYAWRRDIDSSGQSVSGEINSASGYITSAIQAC